MGWANICRRRLKVFSLALVIYMDYKASQKRNKWVSKIKKEEIWRKTHERNARRLLNLIIGLEGLWVKLGQYLSTRADVLPEAYICLLRQLQDSLPPRPLMEVKRTIEEQLGDKLESLFSKFDDEPLATASIAQVHRATLANGKEVVVKVQHEGIKRVILEDLKNAKAIINWIAWAEPQYDFNPLIDEWCREAPRELDFNIEAENTRRVSENLRCKTAEGKISGHNDVDVLIPEIIQSTEKVLILEFMDGVRLNDYEALDVLGVDRQKLVEEITRAYAHQLYVDGFFNGDPHPGNFLVSREAPHRPILLDFGLTKSISVSMKQALAKMFLAGVEGDHVALLSAFAEMGLKLRVDIPEQAMEVTNVVFRTTTPANEALESMKALSDQRTKNMKVIQEKMNLSNKEMARFNPVDAFPGDAVIFFRVLNLLRGLSSTLNVRIVYQEIMRPFAESTLKGLIGPESLRSTTWIADSQVHSEVEAELRKLLVALGKDKVLGIQVCAYKDGKVIIDTAAGVLGRYDPRPVGHDSLFPVFSATKGVTAGMVHWLADQGKLGYEEAVSSIWPEFGVKSKDQIKVHHVLNHTSGLANAMADVIKDSPLVMCDWDESLKRIAAATPETPPGSLQQYHYLSFGWLCGAIIEHASGRKLQEILEEAIVQPLGLHGELYIGIPPGVEERLATLTLDLDDIERLAELGGAPEAPAVVRERNMAEMAAGLPVLFNTLNARRAVIPAANGHCSARALARYYAALAAAGAVPPPHSSFSAPPLGSRPHQPKFPAPPSKSSKKLFGGSSRGKSPAAAPPASDVPEKKTIFSQPSIRDAFMGRGEYSELALPEGVFGLGFRRLGAAAFGHSGIGGSTGFCDAAHDFSIAVTVNKMSLGGTTRSVIQLVCSHLGVPVPPEFSATGARGPDMRPNLPPPL